MSGVIRWFATNRVAANLLMIFIIAGGVMTLINVPQEVFPEFDLDMIQVSVVYLGAAPDEVEQGVNVRIEEAVQGIDGIKKITSTAAENMGTVMLELEIDADARKVLDDVKTNIDAIETFPAETEKPNIRELTNRQQVVDVAVYGDTDERSLKRLAERVRDELTALPEITQAEIANARPYEMAIEVSETALRRHGLSFDFVANAVRRSSLDLPGGSVKTTGGEILLRTKGQAYSGDEFADLVLMTRPDGTHLILGDIAEVVDGFADTDQITRFDGLPALTVKVYRTGAQQALDVAGAAIGYVEQAQAQLPEGLYITTWQDQSKVLRDRLDLLLRNGRVGFVLVFISLALFLRLRLAFWVSIGIPISFLGAIWLMPTLGVSINLMSLFAFILVLGLVVDDAIVVGENIYTQQQSTRHGVIGAISGADEVSKPVIFAVLTTMAAFAPLLNVPGTMGKIMVTPPIIVMSCLLFSLIESLLILPAHLSHRPERPDNERGLWFKIQRRITGGLHWVIARIYIPSVDFGLRWRYLTVAVGTATLVLTIGLVQSGFIRFIFMPDIEADFVVASLTMPQGTPVDVTSRAVGRLEDAANQLRQEVQDEHGIDVYRHTQAAVGGQPMRRQMAASFGAVRIEGSSAHLGEVTIELISAELRGTVSSEAMANRWRELAGSIPDAVSLSYSASLFDSGEDVNIQFTGLDLDMLTAAANDLKMRLAGYDGVHEIADSFLEGKQELKLAIKPEAEMLGLTLADLGRQVRQGFYGEEAQRIQRGRDDVRVMVRYPESERRSVSDLETTRIRTPAGVEVPFNQVAEVVPGRGFSTIERVDRSRAVRVTAQVDTAVTTPGTINAELAEVILPEMMLSHPGVRYSFEGEAAEQRDTVTGLTRGFALALLAIYGLLAIPLRSYVQPLIIMSAIPFGIVGAIWGHMIMGLDLTILSMFGVVALAGVVVNDSLVLVDFINRRREAHDDLLDAVRSAGAVRFRPIMLTSVTTFAGLFPMLLEKSLQAQFLIPMAVSLAFGVIFATFVTLVLVPSGYLIVEDFKNIPARLRGAGRDGALSYSPDPGRASNLD
ncbi:MAG: AcrB/AcrD/AcrF family protein [Acidobacteria bacterium]|nr:AcrB/AcrD/AcrF family protein [Acidobacteriota bacterium]